MAKRKIIEMSKVIERIRKETIMEMLQDIYNKIREMSNREIETEKDLGYKEALLEILEYLYENYTKKL